MPDCWIADTDTYNKLQKLKVFVNFISALKYATEKDKQAASEIINLIENINKPETFKSWNVCLDIFDREIQYGANKKEGFYWRSWSVYFEIDTIEIEVKSRHTCEPLGHYGDDFNFYAMVSFVKENTFDRIYMPADVESFVADALKYESYITESLNVVEIDIEVAL
jgi:hypothetical protein